MPFLTNCLTETLDRLTTQGGYFVMRKSSARETGHVMHVGDEGLQHYSPGAPLGHPARALIGFDGVTWDREMADAPPMSERGIVLSGLLLAGGVLVWYAKRKVRSIFKH